MKTFIIWLVLFSALISTIVFLLVVRSGFNNPFTSNTVTEVATTSTPMPFDQATVYTCGEGSIIALAYKTDDHSVVELSLPVIGPLILTATVVAGKYSNNAGYEMSEIAGVVQISKDSEVLYANCIIGTKDITEELVTTTIPLVSTKWQWLETAVASGTVTRPNKPDDFSITFATENKFSATTDCNNVGGTYSIGFLDVLTFTDMVSTLMACEGDTKEAQFTSQLTQVSSYFIDGNKLTLSLTGMDIQGQMSFVKL